MVLAPMAGITSHPFRLLAKEQGCGLVYSEMISARGLVHGERGRHLFMVYHTDRERPVAFQIFGSEPAIMAEAAIKLEYLGADIIDLNFSCPAPKVTRRGQGGALMKDLELCRRIMEAVSGAVDCPVTVKMRKGWDDQTPNAPALAVLAAESGIKAVAVHGRTVEQGYNGRADWDIIREVKRAAPDLTVIGNGDIEHPADVERRIQQSRCDGIMVGRAARGNPWIFKQINHWRERGELLPGPSENELRETVIRHLDLLCRLKGERIALLEMRGQAAFYLRGLPGVSRIRRQLMAATNRERMSALITGFLGGGGPATRITGG